MSTKTKNNTHDGHHPPTIQHNKLPFILSAVPLKANKQNEVYIVKSIENIKTEMNTQNSIVFFFLKIVFLTQSSK